MADEVLLRFARRTEAFQRMAATELRLLAQQTPEAADYLAELAETLDAHADEAEAVKQLSGKG